MVFKLSRNITAVSFSMGEFWALASWKREDRSKPAKPIKKTFFKFLKFYKNNEKTFNAFEFYKECNKNNLAIVPGKVFFIDDSIYSNYIRISFGAVSNEEIIEGIRIMDNILGKPFKDKGNSYMPFI